LAGVNLRLDYVMANGECLSVAYGHLFNCVSLCLEDFQTLYADELLQKFIWHSDVFKLRSSPKVLESLFAQQVLLTLLDRNPAQSNV
jgi:hypothetical protein